VWEALLFVFAFFITKRIASLIGEGKKECEEERNKFHGVFLCATEVQYPYCFRSVNKKRARGRVGMGSM